MSYITADRVKESSTIIGTGTIPLLGSAVGFRTFASQMSVGDTCSYVIANTTGSEWEVGIATYSAANTLTRTTVQSSTNANAVVNFSAGMKDVFISPTAQSVIDYNPITHQISNADSIVASSVASGVGNSLTITAGNGVGVGAGGNIVLAPGSQGSSGGNGKVIINNDANINQLTIGKGIGQGYDNTVFGVEALNSSSSALSNTALGYHTLKNNSEGAANTAIGSYALEFNDSGYYGTAIGAYALYVNTGSQNTAVGAECLGAVTTGSNNVAIGAQAGANLVNGSNNILIGKTVYSPATSTSNFMTIGNLIFASGGFGTYNDIGTGNVGIGQASPTAKLHVKGSSSSTQGVIVQGASSQTANLQEWQNSAATALAYVNASGTLYDNAVSALPVASGVGNNLTLTAGSGVGTGAGGSLVLQAGVQATSGGDGKVVVKQAVGQTSNLQEWQDSSAGIKAFVDSSGNIATGLNAYSNRLYIGPSVTSYLTGGSQSTGLLMNGNAQLSIYAGATEATRFFLNSILIRSGHEISWCSNIASGSINATITSDGAATLAQRNATNPQAFRVYNTYTDASNYERFGITWSSNICTIGLAQAGTGAVRTLAIAGATATSGAGGDVTITAGSGTGTGAGGSLVLKAGIQATSGGDGKVIVRQVSGQTSSLQEWQDSSGSVLASLATTGRMTVPYLDATTATFAAGTISASTPNTITQTWNNAAVTFTGLNINVTDVASNASSLLADLQVGSVSQFQVDKSGAIAIAHNAGVKKLLGLTAATGSASTGIYAYGSVGSAFAYHAAGSFGWGGGSTGMIVNSNLDGAFMWATTANDGNPTLRLYRDANDTLAQRRSTNPQAFRVYNTYTDASNYERLGITWASNVCTIGLAQAGTGLPRTLNVNANALNAPALPVAATVTAATGNGTTVTYTCASTFAIGQVVSITGLTITTGSSLNLSNQTITGVTATTFTVSNATVGTAAATQAGTATIQSAGNSVTITGGNGSGVGGTGGNIILQPGAQGSSGGNGIVQCTKKLEFYTGSSKTDLAFQINNSTTGMWYHSGANMFVWTINNTDTICFRQGYIRLSKGGGIYWSNTTNDAITLPDDTSIYSASRGVFAVDAPMQSVNSQGGSLAFKSFATTQTDNVNDWVMGPSAFQRVNCTTASSITGIAPYTSGVHVDGRMIRIYNVGNANLTLSHNNAASTTGNKFYNSTGADIILAFNDYAELIYDSTNNGSGNAGWRVS